MSEIGAENGWKKEEPRSVACISKRLRITNTIIPNKTLLINFLFIDLLPLRICLGTVYLTETENFLLKILSIKLKVNWNSTSGPINNTKKCNGTYK